MNHVGMVTIVAVSLWSPKTYRPISSIVISHATMVPSHCVMASDIVDGGLNYPAGGSFVCSQMQIDDRGFLPSYTSSSAQAIIYNIHL